MEASLQQMKANDPSLQEVNLNNIKVRHYPYPLAYPGITELVRDRRLPALTLAFSSSKSLTSDRITNNRITKEMGLQEEEFLELTEKTHSPWAKRTTLCLLLNQTFSFFFFQC